MEYRLSSNSILSKMMLPTPRILIIFIFPILGVFVILHSYSDDVKDRFRTLTQANFTPEPSNFRSSIAQLFEPVLHSPTENYTDAKGQIFPIQSPIWTEPLGRKILIVDIDTRAPDGPNQLLSKGGDRLDYDRNSFQRDGDLVSNAIFDHYLYAQIHGYDYKFYQASKMEGYYDTWILPHVLLELLAGDEEYDFVVTMDADVSVTHPEVPMEFLFNKWGVSPRTSIAMPWDTQENDNGKIISLDDKGVRVLNTGLVVVQNLAYTTEMLEAWRDCPDESRYPGCAQWRYSWSHEQRAFSEYIRYDFNPDDDNIVAIPCDDAEGWPGMMEQYPGRIVSDCNGQFFRHHTLNKEKAKESVAASIMQVLYGMMQDSVREDMDEVWIVEGSNEPGSVNEGTGEIDV